ncbi:MAG: hypothetical protein E4H02_12215 [Lentisphaerales bacterium]|nr:MAG: hypothetical protein E4H02_12215 [Lentisphaerales bacterium]
MTAEKHRDALHPEARGVVAGAITAGAGQGMVALIGILMSVIIPRLFGAGDYGLWVWYRSIVNLALTFCTLGALQTIVCHYIPMKAAGHDDQAASLLKSLAAVRLTAFLVAALVSSVMLLVADTALSRPINAAMIATSVFVRGLLSVPMMILYSERRIRAMLSMQVLLSLIVPGSVATAYVLGDVRSIPIGCVLGDTICTAVGLWVARPWRLLGANWMRFKELRPIMLFGASIGVSSIMTSLFMSTAPYFMSLRQYSAESLAYVGISIRMTSFLIGALVSVSAAVIPTFSAVLERDGVDRVVRWHGLLSRFGFALILCVLGNAFLLADKLVPLVWGSAFRPMSAVMIYSVAALIPLWLGSQMIRYVLFFKRSTGYLLSSLLQLLLFVGLLFALTEDSAGQNTMLAMILAGTAFMLCAAVMYFRRTRLSWNWLRFVPAVFMVGVAHSLGPRSVGLIQSAVTAILWTTVFVLVVFGFGGARVYEIRDILGLVTLRGDRNADKGFPA